MARSFRGLPSRRGAWFPFVITAGAPPTSAVLYAYENVGLYFGPDTAGIQYAYENVGLPPTFWPIIGRVIAALNDTYGVVYLYENVT